MRSPRVTNLHHLIHISRFSPRCQRLSPRPKMWLNNAYELLNKTALLLSLSHHPNPHDKVPSRPLCMTNCGRKTLNHTPLSRSSWPGTVMPCSNSSYYAKSTLEQEEAALMWTQLQGNQTSWMTVYITRTVFPSRLSSSLLWQFSLQHIFSFNCYNYGLYMHLELLYFHC